MLSLTHSYPSYSIDRRAEADGLGSAWVGATPARRRRHSLDERLVAASVARRIEAWLLLFRAKYQERASRSKRVTMSASPGSSRLSSLASSARSVFAPDTFSP
jgi:hypothetical protein